MPCDWQLDDDDLYQDLREAVDAIIAGDAEVTVPKWAAFRVGGFSGNGINDLVARKLEPWLSHSEGEPQVSGT